MRESSQRGRGDIDFQEVMISLRYCQCGCCSRCGLCCSCYCCRLCWGVAQRRFRKRDKRDGDSRSPSIRPRIVMDSMDIRFPHLHIIESRFNDYPPFIRQLICAIFQWRKSERSRSLMREVDHVNDQTLKEKDIYRVCVTKNQAHGWSFWLISVSLHSLCFSSLRFPKRVQ